MPGRKLKHTIREILENETLDEGVKRILFFPYGSTIGPLISFFCNRNMLVKWKAVSVLGIVTSRIAETDPEYARVIMRRLMWSLNDESGGIGWGVPEAMGEIMALSDLLSGEYHKILVSYISPGANFIEVPALQKGVLWGIARLASEKPHYLSTVIPCLNKFLDSEDASLRGLSAFAMLKIDKTTIDSVPSTLMNDPSPIEYYQDGELGMWPIKDLLNLVL